MSKRIGFGDDIFKILKKNGYNIVGEIPTKYKNGITTIYFMWSKAKDINKMNSNTPYIEYTIDEETDGFIDGMCYVDGEEGYGVEVKFYEDVRYFIENAWIKSDLNENKNYKSIKENLYNNKKAITYIAKYCDKLNIACVFVGNTVTVYKDLINNEGIEIEFETINQVISEINDYFEITESKKSIKPLKSKDFVQELLNSKYVEPFEVRGITVMEFTKALINCDSNWETNDEYNDSKNGEFLKYDNDETGESIICKLGKLKRYLGDTMISLVWKDCAFQESTRR